MATLLLGLLRLSGCLPPMSHSIDGWKLVKIASISDTSNHVAGTRALGLAAVADFDGDGVTDIAIPSLDRSTLRFITFKGGARELGRKSLTQPATTDFTVEKDRGRPITSLSGRAKGTSSACDIDRAE